MSETQQEQEIPKDSRAPICLYISYFESGTKDVHGEKSNTPLCNFYMKVDSITEIDDMKLLNGEFFITSSSLLPFNFKEDNENDYIKKPFNNIDNTALYTDKDFVGLMKTYPEMWHRQGKVKSLRTEITKELSTLILGNMIKKTKKVQDFGWNNNFISFSTPELSISLVQHEVPDPFGGKGYAPSFIHDYNEYEIKYSEGSVHILNDKISKKIRLGLKSGGKDEIKKTLIHIKDVLLNLHPKMKRIIPIVFLAPLKTPLLRLGKSYQAYLQGTSGYGKTQLCYLLMGFFSDIQSPEDLVSITGRTTTGAIKEIGYYHKDCLFVIDNFKEEIMGNRVGEFVSMLQSIADNQDDHRMSGSQFGSYKVRGTTIVTGEEAIIDASTIRKFDTIRFDEKINLEIRKICESEKDNYPYVITALVEMFIKKYGDNIEVELENRFKAYESIFQDPLFLLNQIGYDLFLELMLYYGVVTEEEYTSMHDSYLSMLRIEEIEKQNLIEEKTSSQKFIDAIRAGLISGQLSLKKDVEYEFQNRPVIGQTNREGTEVSIYDDAYSVIRNFNHTFYNLPRDRDSVYTQLKEDIENGEVLNVKFDKAIRNKVKKKVERMITFDRGCLLPFGNDIEMVKLSDIAMMLNGLIKELGIVSQPTIEQYNNLIKTMANRYLPKHDKKRVLKFKSDIEPLIISAFGSREWVIP